MTKFSDLPPSVQRQIQLGLGEAQPLDPPKSKPLSKKILDGITHGSCACGEKFPTYRKWERHSDQHPEGGHARYNIDLQGAQ